MSEITIRWENSSRFKNSTANTVYRSTLLGFDNQHANIQTMTTGSTGTLSPTAVSGSYVDNSVQEGNHYLYRVEVTDGSQTAISLSTKTSYVYDPRDDLGYSDGWPAETSTYITDVAPVFHFDAQRQYGHSHTHNEIIIDASSFVRHDRENVINTVGVHGEPLFDSRPVNLINRFMISKTQNPHRGAGATASNVDTKLLPQLSSDVTVSDQFTLAVVAYQKYVGIGVESTHQLSNTGGGSTLYDPNTITWSSSSVSVDTGFGSWTFNRTLNSNWAVWIMRGVNTPAAFNNNDTGVQMWENGIYTGRTAIGNSDSYHGSGNIGLIHYDASDIFDLLPNTGSEVSAGISEYILFDTALEKQDINL